MSIAIRAEHTFRFANGMELKPAANYRWEESSYTSIWNADKHINDEGGFDGPGYFSQPIEVFTDRRPAWEMWDYFLTLDSKQGWYVQGYSYNATSNIIPWALWIEAGNPRGSYSAPAQKGVRFGYFW